MQNVVIRIATFKDRNSIEQVYSASAGTGLSLAEAEWTKWIKNQGLLVAEVDGQPVGFGGIMLSNQLVTSGQEANLASIQSRLY